MSPTTSEPLELPDLGELSRLHDEDVMRLQSRLAALRRRVDAASAEVAGEISRRSSRELGHAGLAQRLGARTPEKLVAHLGGMSAPEARAMVTVGESLAGDAPWLRPVVAGVAAGDLSVGAAAAIRVGLGTPSDAVPAADLTAAAERLAEAAATLPPEKVAARARQARDELDEAGVADREAILRGRRFLRLIPQDDGMTRLVGLLDPEGAALVSDAVDRVTMPRRGGVRFVDPAENTRSEAIVADSRTTEQIAIDALVEMVRIAGRVDDGRVFGQRGPAVRVHVSLADLERRSGVAEFEAQSAGISIPTVERAVCATGILPILFDDDGRAMKLGRKSRLFSARQRVAIAARDGGCLAPGCDRPPSWCEAHHINEWLADHGLTDVDDGVLLCSHHHKWVHNTGARIARHQAQYRLHTADGKITILHSKSRIAQRQVSAARARHVAA